MGWLNLANQITRGVHDEFYSRLNPHINIQTNISLINWQIFDIQIHYEYLWILDSPTNSIHISISTISPWSPVACYNNSTHQLTSAAPKKDPPKFSSQLESRQAGDIAEPQRKAILLELRRRRARGVVTIDFNTNGLIVDGTPMTSETPSRQTGECVIECNWS